MITEKTSSSQNIVKIEKTLRGSQTFYVKVTQKPFILTVKKQDQNAYKGEDNLSVQVYYGEVKMAEQTIPDDGVIDASGLKMTEQKSEIKIDDPKLGIYKVILQDKTENADVITTSIEVNQSLLVFSPRMFVVDEKPTALWTNAKKLTLFTSHAPSIQAVKLDNKYDLKVKKEGQSFDFNLNKPEATDNTKDLHRFDIPKNDLIINGDGYFAFSRETFFNPEPIDMVDLSTVSDSEKIDYIIANYQPVKKEGEWKVAQAYFDPKDIKIDGDKLYFSLESPELNSYGGEIVIDNLEVTVKKPAWLIKSEASPSPTPAAKIGKPNLFQKIALFFQNLFSKKKSASQSPSDNLSPTTEPSLTMQPSPTPDPKKEITIQVFNSGAGKGAAGRFADVLKNAGFAKAEATNAASFDLKNANVSYNEKDPKATKELIEEIIGLLKKSYDIVKEDTKAKESGIIKVTLGENPKEVTPTPRANTSTPTPKPTTKL